MSTSEKNTFVLFLVCLISSFKVRNVFTFIHDNSDHCFFFRLLLTNAPRDQIIIPCQRMLIFNTHYGFHELFLVLLLTMFIKTYILIDN